MRVLVTGSGGIVGSALARARPARVELVARTHAELDVTDRARTLDAIAAARPDFVIHCAAFTDVDRCEQEVERAFRVNWLGTAHVADACERVGAVPVYLSSDYVFDGAKEEPYVEEDVANPLSVYGASKRYGELDLLARRGRAYLVRTQWIFGAGGRNFVDTMLKLAREKSSLQVVDDQRGAPTWAGHLAPAIWRILEADPGPGLYHVAARGAATWFEFARAIFGIVGASVAVAPCTSAEFPRPARRPRNSVLRNRRLEQSLGELMPPWQEGIARYLSELSEGRARREP